MNHRVYIANFGGYPKEVFRTKKGLVKYVEEHCSKKTAEEFKKEFSRKPFFSFDGSMVEGCDEFYVEVGYSN